MCKEFGYSRQGFHKRLKHFEKQLEQEKKAVEIILNIRGRQPRVGVKKMLDTIQYQLILQGYEPIGRDRLFDVLRQKDLLIKPLKRCKYTTDSYHRFRTYKNLLSRIVPTKPNQAWVADITYLRLRGNTFCYLFLITDAYSRKIVGYNVAPTLEVKGAIKALKMALRQCKDAQEVIHHSDRGIQYCCDAYVDILQNKSVIISMTEKNHCYENAIAERVNGILKGDFLLGEVLPTYQKTKKIVKEVIEIYNNERWHQSLNYMTPAMKHAA